MILLQLFNGSCIELGAVRRGQDSELAQQAVQEIQQRRPAPAPAPAPATKEKDPAPVGPKEPKAKVEATQKIEAPEPDEATEPAEPEPHPDVPLPKGKA